MSIKFQHHISVDDIVVILYYYTFGVFVYFRCKIWRHIISIHNN